MLKLSEIKRAFAEDSLLPEEKQDFLLEVLYSLWCTLIYVARTLYQAGLFKAGLR